MISLALVLAPAGCRAPRPTAAAWLSQRPNEVVFLQWTRRGARLTGSATLAFVYPMTPTQAATETAQFGGVLEGTSVELAFPPGGDVGTRWHGTVSGDEMVLSHAGNDGILTQTFRPSTAGAFARVVASLLAAAAKTSAQHSGFPPAVLHE